MPAVGASARLLTVDAVGGVWRYGIELARGLAATGVATVIAVLGPDLTATQRAEARAIGRLVETGLELDWTASDETALRRSAEALASLAAEADVSLAHLHAPAFAAFGKWPVPVVSVAHSCVGTWWRAVRGGTPPEELRWRAAATGRGLACSDAAIAPTRAFAELLRAEYGAVRVTVVRNGTCPPRPAPDAPRQPAVLTVGRLWDEAKNVAALDRVAGRIGAPILAAGSLKGPNGAAASLHRVRHLGTLDAATLRRLYATIAIYASPARYEPFGLGVLEAAQSGMALVLSDIPTFRELWDGAALFVPPDDEDALAHAIANLLDAPGSRGQLGALAREKARRYSAGAMVRGTLEVHAAAEVHAALRAQVSATAVL